MRSRKAKWLCGLGAMVLIGIPVLAMAEPWDKNLPSSGRFQVLSTFQNKAVLDKNTGLVWEQAPDATPRKWQGEGSVGATSHCVNKTVGGTVGWRLPSVAELKSVQNPSLPAPFVPAIFTGVQSDSYWSATTDAGNPDNAWVVLFSLGDVGDVFFKGNDARAWCVRGGMNADAY